MERIRFSEGVTDQLLHCIQAFAVGLRPRRLLIVLGRVVTKNQNTLMAGKKSCHRGGC